MKTLMMEIYTDPSVWLFGESSHGVGVFRLVLIQPGGIYVCVDALVPKLWPGLAQLLTH
jgi:hypothetical protein